MLFLIIKGKIILVRSNYLCNIYMSKSGILLGLNLAKNALTAIASSAVYGNGFAEIAVFEVKKSEEITNIVAKGTASLPSLTSSETIKPNALYDWESTIAVKKEGLVNIEIIYIPVDPEPTSEQPFIPDPSIYGSKCSVDAVVTAPSAPASAPAAPAAANVTFALTRTNGGAPAPIEVAAVLAEDAANTEVSAQWVVSAADSNVKPLGCEFCNPPSTAGLVSYSTLLQTALTPQERLAATNQYTFTPTDSAMVGKGPELTMLSALAGLVNAANNSENVDTLKASTLLSTLAAPFVSAS